jgi:hypothetical protein
MIVVAESLRDSTWYVINTQHISRKAGKGNCEPGKMALHMQHRYNLREGQIMHATIVEWAILRRRMARIDYSKENLGLQDSVIRLFLDEARERLKESRRRFRADPLDGGSGIQENS